MASLILTSELGTPYWVILNRPNIPQPLLQTITSQRNVNDKRSTGRSAVICLFHLIAEVESPEREKLSRIAKATETYYYPHSL